jgi:hypothetical protein
VKIARRLFFLTLAVFTMFEAGGGFALQQLGWYLQQDLKKWLPIGIPFSVLELCLLASGIAWLARSQREKREYRYQPSRLTVPLIAFAAALALGVLWGLSRGGDNLTFALFEVRASGLMIYAIFLVGMVVRDDHDLTQLVWALLLACTYLTVDNTLHYFTLPPSTPLNPLTYDHDDSVVLAFGFILCLALLAFGGSRAQRGYAIVLAPSIIWCLMIMQRRAAFAVLAVGVMALAIIFYRLRPKRFWLIVPPLAVLLGIYLAAFWHSESVLGQPARAISSLYSPDPRDASSNLYRDTEHADILANIATSRWLGLGFGQTYIFYYPLPDVGGGWPFWHYTSHNSVLWLWMDGGVPVFFTFWWLMGIGTYRGGQELALRREAWSLAQLRWRQMRRLRRPKRRANRRVDTAQMNQGDVAIGTRARAVSSVRTGPEAAATLVEGAAQLGRPTAVSRLGPAGPSTALLASAICLVAMQITFSYVELGIESSRLMLLLGVMLGVLGRTYAPRVPRARRPRRGASQRVASPGRPRAAEPEQAALARDRGEALAPIGPAVGKRA